MKASDLTSSSSEREEESRALLHTERTDAVNTGIVDSADRTSRTDARKVSKADRADELTGHRPHKGGQGTDADASADDAASEGPSARSGNLKGKAAKGAKGLAAKAARKAVRGTELEGTDDVVYGAYAAYRGGKWMRNRLADRKAKKDDKTSASERKRKLSLQGRNDEVAATSDGPHGTQRGSDGGKAARSAKKQSSEQMSRYYKREVYTTAEKTTAKKASKPLIQRLLASSKEGGAGGAVASAAGGCLPIFIIVLILFLVIMGVVGAIGGDNESSSSSSLTTTEQQVASFFLDKGLDELHTAAIMGNMYAESGIDPAAEEDGGTGIGICQWSYGRADNLRSYAAQEGKNWTNLSLQLDFFWDHDIWSTDWSSTYTIRQKKFDGDPEVGEHVSGSKAGFLATDDLEEAVKSFCYGWERPGIPHMSVRLEAAQRYYSALTSGSYTGGEDYANAESWQKAIVQAAYNTPSTGSGYCAAWVSNVYQNAGLGYVGGNACCMYYNYCTSSDTDDLKVGMLVAFPRSETSYRNSCSNCGHLGYGHVGIYIGDGMVISNRGSIVVETLESFASTAYSGYVAKWGYPSGVPSS